MLFKISYAIKEELVHSAQTQFAGGDEKWYGMKLMGRWREPSSTGFMVVETDDEILPAVEPNLPLGSDASRYGC